MITQQEPNLSFFFDSQLPESAAQFRFCKDGFNGHEGTRWDSTQGARSVLVLLGERLRCLCFATHRKHNLSQLRFGCNKEIRFFQFTKKPGASFLPLLRAVTVVCAMASGADHSARLLYLLRPPFSHWICVMQFQRTFNPDLNLLQVRMGVWIQAIPTLR